MIDEISIQKERNEVKTNFLLFEPPICIQCHINIFIKHEIPKDCSFCNYPQYLNLMEVRGERK